MNAKTFLFPWFPFPFLSMLTSQVGLTSQTWPIAKAGQFESEIPSLTLTSYFLLLLTDLSVSPLPDVLILTVSGWSFPPLLPVY